VATFDGAVATAATNKNKSRLSAICVTVEFNIDACTVNASTAPISYISFYSRSDGYRKIIN